MADAPQWSKKPGRMQTPWFDRVDETNPFPEYPRPQMVREKWLNLNGLWEYAVTAQNIDKNKEYGGQILVPFPIEAPLSGVERALTPLEWLWYRRTFKIPGEWGGQRILLHFGAVDWETTVWVNNHKFEPHRGGYSPFSYDITDLISMHGTNEVIIKVFDPSDAGRQPYGKQTLKPKTVFYTPSSGIWQTVWLEPVPETYIEKVKITPDLDNKQLHVDFTVQSMGAKKNHEFRGKITAEGREIPSTVSRSESGLTFGISDVHPWAPEDPFLYNIELEVVSEGKVQDRIKTYFGMRKFSLVPGEGGVPKFHLNNKPYFLMGPLDQGFWPDGLYTAPTDAALKWDVKLTKDCGYNMIRKHIKTEPARWYHYCDTLGIIVIQDMPNGGKMKLVPPGMLLYAMGKNLDDTKHYKKFGREPSEVRSQFERELRDLLDSLMNVPSIGIWCPFNEAWGQYDAKRIGDWVMQYDPTRLVDHASGWFDRQGGHFISLHNYRDTFQMVSDPGKRGVLLSETGGYTMKNVAHCWDPKKNFGYKKAKSGDELRASYKNMVETILAPALKAGLSGFVYTQTSDVEIEYNGLATYDRQMLKFDPAVLKSLHQQLTKPKK